MARTDKLAPLHSSAKQDWETPRDFFDVLSAGFKFNVDMAASKKNSLLPNYWSVKDSAFDHDWRKYRGFVNPPYSRSIPEWTRRAADEWRKGYKGRNCTVMLLPARTDVKWWWDVKDCCETVFLKGRLKFRDPSSESEEPVAAPFPSMLLLFRSEEYSPEPGTISTWDWRDQPEDGPW